MMNKIKELFTNKENDVDRIANAIASGDYNTYKTILNEKIPTNRKLKRSDIELSGWINAPKVMVDAVFASYFSNKCGLGYENIGNQDYLTKESMFYNALKGIEVEVGNSSKNRTHYIIFKKDGRYLARANCLDDFFMLDMNMRVQFKNVGVKEIDLNEDDKKEMVRHVMLIPDWLIFSLEEVHTPYTKWVLDELINIGKGIYKSIQPEFDKFIEDTVDFQCK